MENFPVKLKLEAPWDVVKERMKENDTRLTDDDLAYVPGKEEQLLQNLGKIMHKSKKDIVAYIESISSNSDLAG